MNSSSPLSSPLSSIGTISQPPSPSPTGDYPSPPCSSVPDTRVPSEAGDAPDCDGPPPAKRRKMTQPKSTEPKARTTEYLDLRNFGEGSEEQILRQDAQMKRLVRVLRGKRKIVVVAGAGISVSAGKPLATRVPLNTKGPWPKTIQLHGGLAKMVCSKCGHLEDFDGALFEGPEAPDCDNCVEIDSVRIAAGSRRHGIGRMRPRMVLYNEYNPDEEAIGAVSAADLKKVADAVIVVGTSLKIPGIRRLVKEMCSTTRDRKNGFTAWINLDGEPGGPEFKDCWDMIVRGECDEVARHAGLPKWDDKDLGQYTVVANEVGSAKKRGIDKVLVTPAHATAAADAFPTPGASPRMQSPTPTNAFSKLKAITKPKGPAEKTTATKSTKRKASTDPKVKKPRAPPKPKTSSKLKKQILPGENLKLSMTTTKSMGAGEAKTLNKDNPRKKLPSKPEIIEPAKLENPFLGSNTSALFPNLKPAVPVVAIPLPTMRPETTLPRKVSTLPNRRQENNPPIRVKSSRLSDTHTIPETPSPSRSPNSITFDRNETITPPSIPKNMDLLIDH
ncbi:hypothetical protein SS1G_06621 [Sclerotinia sclerotiorum 1980 UF-70]|uniref:Deacetylase sirtuin-type domain-containing protein n=1 Tax=Sclerotinia sclerotiorum (strain ATCC 18683 / 1980 / Ss-1) TaxID=665079 RepID=A7EMS2_SCLS1|nr:hypothetical protein SS1G_06621 [Sclerotinia sclerotiorum 1980 UF-70]EDO04138.1 hypothetical protein SS1G_06621 [Sclerotinia sclerotiorum 1980 UF-70]